MESSTVPETTAAAAAAAIDTHSCTLYFFIAGTCFLGVFIVIGIIGNSFTLVIMRNERKKSSTIDCLFWLATADIMLCVVEALAIFPMGLRKFAFGWFNGRNYNFVSSLAFVPLMHTFNQVSTFLTVLVTLQRFISVCVPHKAKQLCTVSLVNKLTIFSYLSSLIFYSPGFFLMTIYVDDGKYMFKIRSFITSKVYVVFYSQVAIPVFSYFIPMLSLIFMSVMIMKGMKSPMMKQSKERSQARRDLTISTITIVAFFTLCQTISFCWKALEWKYYPFGVHASCGGKLFPFSMVPHLAYMVNSSVNFFIYIVFTKGFRTKFLNFFRKKKNQVQATSEAGTASTVSK